MFLCFFCDQMLVASTVGRGTATARRDVLLLSCFKLPDLFSRFQGIIMPCEEGWLMVCNCTDWVV